jgi:uncharacterized protein (TIGR03000 family)
VDQQPPPVPQESVANEQPAPVDAAVMRVTVPDASAQVFLNGQPTSSTGTVRRYVTPHLDAGKAYTYDLRAVWSRGGQSLEANRQIAVTAGRITNVDLTRPDPTVPKGGFGGGARTF